MASFRRLDSWIRHRSQIFNPPKMHHLLYGHINKIVSKSLNLIIETYCTRISHTHCALSCKNNYCFYLQGVQSLLWIHLLLLLPTKPARACIMRWRVMRAGACFLYIGIPSINLPSLPTNCWHNALFGRRCLLCWCCWWANTSMSLGVCGISLNYWACWG